MVKRGCRYHYSINTTQEREVVKAKATNVKAKFKNLVETASVVRGMTTQRADAYLKNVLARKECVPFRHFKSGVGRCAQAKQFKVINGRWPVNAVKCIQDLLRNAIANCEFYGKDPEDFFIFHLQVSQAPVSMRRTYRAHGRINPYERHVSHIQMVLKDKNTK